MNTTTTWVIADHINSPGCPGDLTVSRGQQVEILDIPSPTTALVRLVPPNATTTGYNSSSTTNSAFGRQNSNSSANTVGSSEQSSNSQFTVSEGTVPISCLKQPPGGFRSQNEIAGT